MNKLLLIDGNSILNRAYFALPPLNGKNGQNVNAVYGFINIMLKAIADTEATHLAVAFDIKGHNFRKDIYPEYKSNRKGMPDDLAAQMPVLHNLLKAMNICIVEKSGIEADDIIGTLSKRFDCKTYIVSGDRDLLQLIDNSNIVLLTKRGVSEVEINDINTIVNNYGLTPEQIIEYKAISGDSSDNIPGISGIGDKGAKNLLNEYNDLDTIYKNIALIKGALQKKLIDGKSDAYMSKTLATIVTDVDIDCTIDECEIHSIANSESKKILGELEFNSIIKKLNFSEETEIIHNERKTAEIINIKNYNELEAILKENKNKESAFFLYENENIAFAYDEDKEYHIDSFSFPINVTLSYFKDYLSGENEKIVYDYKSLKHRLDKYSMDIFSVRYDVAMMDYLTSYRPMQSVESFFEKYNESLYAVGMLRIKNELVNALNSTQTMALYTDIERPLMDVLYDMEKQGFRADRKVLDELSVTYKNDISQLSEEAYILAGEKFNLLSPKQLSVILFEKLQLPHGKKTKTGYSTDSDVLEGLINEHPIVPIILKVRQLSKLNGTYIEGIRNCLDKNDMIHTTFNQTLTVTGRLSSSEPNLQNLPVRTEMGKEIRKIFVPQYDLLISADYSQIELRLLAEFSKDKALTDAFNNNQDIHATVASELFNVPVEMVTSNMRRTAKAVNFGIIYGISNYGLAQNTGLSPAKAKEYIKKYFDSFPTIHDYLNGLVDEAKNNGYVTTITNRRRMLPEINSKNFNIRTFAERAAMNMPLQGSAADIMKIAMIKVYNSIKEQKLKSKMILQIHDELIIDTVESEKEQIEKILIDCMENAVKTHVKLSVNVESGVNLYEAK